MDHSPRFLKICEDAIGRVHEVSIDQVRAKIAAGESPTLIDVREDHEWADGHIKGARHIGRGVLERDVEKQFPNIDSEIILYCGGGFRSALAADNLQKMGYTRVLSMAGGWRGWKAAGGEIET
jgi:rhodanese-related sulfurtransferase